MPEYRSRLFESDDGVQLPVPQVKARGWSADLRGLTLTGTHKFVSTKAREERYGTIIESTDLTSTGGTNRYAPEIIIIAPSREHAQRAQSLISATSALFFANPVFEDMAVVPCNELQPEGLRADQMTAALGSAFSTTDLWRATRIAAQATQRIRWKFAAAKYLASLKASSVHPMEHHPHRGSHYEIEKDPVEIVRMAEAIALGYSAIEEIGLEVRASRERPSKIKGEWNPPVLENLRARLKRAGVNENEEFDWLLRGAPRLIEQRYSPPAGKKTPWTRRRIRDRQVPVVDAINYASLLRSKAAAHASGSLTRSLTMADVSNVQDLARRLILEALGSWRTE